MMCLMKISSIILFVGMCHPGLATSNQTNPGMTVSEVEGALVILKNLTTAQKMVWEQQDTYEKEVRSRNRDEEARQVTRTRALEKEQHLLKEIWALLARKLKSLSKGSDNHDVSHVRPKDCADVYLEGHFSSGVYKIWPTWFKNSSSFPVYCDMETGGGGWTVIHRWGSFGFPSDYFRRSLAEYKNGFGNLESSFWLGNDLITALTSQGTYKLLFETHKNPSSVFSAYNSFWTEHESKQYKLHVEGFDASSNGGNVFSAHNGGNFQLLENIHGQCSQVAGFRPAWWIMNSCNFDQALYLNVASTSQKDHFSSEMKIRPANFQKMKETP